MFYNFFFLSGDLSDGESVVNWLQEFVSTPAPSLQEGSAQYDEDQHVWDVQLAHIPPPSPGGCADEEPDTFPTFQNKIYETYGCTPPTSGCALERKKKEWWDKTRPQKIYLLYIIISFHRPFKKVL